MTDRQRFWLKVVLAVTIPIWLLPAILGAFFAMVGRLLWKLVSEIVDDVSSEADWDGP